MKRPDELDEFDGLCVCLNLCVLLDGRDVDRLSLDEVPLLQLESSKLLDESLVGVCLLTLRLDELKDIIEAALEKSHQEHDCSSGRAGHAHRAVDQHTVLIAVRLLVDLVSELLELVKQRVLVIFCFTERVLFLEIDV